MTVLKNIQQARDFLMERGMVAPVTGIILGTGLGKLVEHIDIHQVVEYHEIPHFPVSTVEFHKGRLLYGKLGGKMVLIMQGRFHVYEGYDLQQITFPVRVMKYLGIRHLLISNAGGAINLDFKKGSLMLINDHINLLGGSPLTGKNENKLGPRFPDMSRPYSAFLNEMMERIAQQNGITLHQGIYAALPGPQLETRAEYRFLRTIGADVVGMSTVPEVIAANHMRLPCAAVSVLTDECDPDHLEPIDIRDILDTAAMAEEDLIRLFSGVVAEI
ncbi:MAG: purine-nucleoside phosphorylase [Bacteroidales bacterium]|nr:purine-nucleoside phosphorylase [Bacteroidales bacterium]